MSRADYTIDIMSQHSTHGAIASTAFWSIDVGIPLDSVNASHRHLGAGFSAYTVRRGIGLLVDPSGRSLFVPMLDRRNDTAGFGRRR